MTTDTEYVKIAEKAWREALEIAKSVEGWKVEKEDKELGDIVESCRNSAGRKIYRCKSTISIPPKLLIAALTDTDRVTTWNFTLTEARTLKKISDTVAISYQVTSDGGGGLVSARDFIYVSMQGYDGRTFVMGGQSVEYKDGPTSGGIVRAVNGPGCQMVIPTGDRNKSQMVWLMDCDYKGWIPQSVLDIAMPFAQTSFLESVRKLAIKLKEEGKF
eukprot:GFUD01028084.1.p2 GENE.GFUD01028084.1~~GFUD01028084.1.p2  ORF type:complete len:233 (-),score=76.99 GFUD01028084.1:43-690(-)